MIVGLQLCDHAISQRLFRSLQNCKRECHGEGSALLWLGGAGNAPASRLDYLLAERESEAHAVLVDLSLLLDVGENAEYLVRELLFHATAAVPDPQSHPSLLVISA